MVEHQREKSFIISRLICRARAAFLVPDGMRRAGREHRTILAACEARDADRAARLTGAHIAGARDSLLRHLAERPGWPFFRQKPDLPGRCPAAIGAGQITFDTIG